MPNFVHASSTMSGKLLNKNVHGGNHAPKPGDWWAGDDTLDRQGVDKKRPKGHGICKGVSSAWVIAFLNGTLEASDGSVYEAYYTNFLRFQATMIKDFGSHIDTHVEKMSALHIETNIKVAEKLELVEFTEKQIPDGRWAAYISVWHHDIAIGGKWGANSTLYINEPNTGLLAYTDKADFFADLKAYIAKRRQRKKLQPTEKAGFWVCRPA
ncbi:hypothetical protein Mag101_13555 [Microbulbifer agarilyticus]|uniref:Peptidase C58 YopT-type domain-containing protein n=1 Tax=Microbulbifer agarilyticus TaxID=260552 RepID=A0A1Q2M8J2_9GAMM|nr:hypothetical protein [Microbulbifer agarilyticus]AQQ68542.1 hypothetical protein Mag101_13555 [Microbulbifer agarilyticus]